VELLPTPNPQPKTLKPIGNPNQKQVKRRNSCVIVKIKQSVVVRIKQLNCVIVKIKQSIPKPSLAYQSLLWHTKAFFGIPKPSLAYQSLLWHTKAFFGIPKSTKAFFGPPKPTKAFVGLLQTRSRGSCVVTSNPLSYTCDRSLE
jgi:hypothetical protein